MDVVVPGAELLGGGAQDRLRAHVRDDDVVGGEGGSERDRRDRDDEGDVVGEGRLHEIADLFEIGDVLRGGEDADLKVGLGGDEIQVRPGVEVAPGIGSYQTSLRPRVRMMTLAWRILLKARRAAARRLRRASIERSTICA